MFEQAIQNVTERMKPAAAIAAGEARTWAHAILCELKNISAILDRDDVEYQRHPVRGNTGSSPAPFIEIPADDTWYLESVTALGTVAGTFTLRDTANAIRYAKALDSGFALNDAPGAQRYTGGTQLVPALTGGAGDFYLVFRSERPKPRDVPAGQYVAPAPTFASSPGAADAERRHIQTGVFPGVNVTGAMRQIHETAEANSPAPI